MVDATPAVPGAATQQWICEAVVPVVRPPKITLTVIMLVVVSHVTTAVPVPAEVGLDGSLSGPNRKPQALKR